MRSVDESGCGLSGGCLIGTGSVGRGAGSLSGCCSNGSNS